MLALPPRAPHSSRPRLTPNLLPAAIKHSGPVPSAPRYWAPVLDNGGHNDNNITTTTQPQHPPESPASTSAQPAQTAAPAESAAVSAASTVYFRGRRLRGRAVPVPRGYEGVVLARTEKRVAAKAPTAEQLRRMEEDSMDGEEEDDGAMGVGFEQPLEVRALEERGRFDEMVVWGHEVLPEPAEDVYVRGITEWVGFAEAMMGVDG